MPPPPPSCLGIVIWGVQEAAYGCSIITYVLPMYTLFSCCCPQTWVEIINDGLGLACDSQPLLMNPPVNLTNKETERLGEVGRQARLGVQCHLELKAEYFTVICVNNRDCGSEYYIHLPDKCVRIKMQAIHQSVAWNQY